MQKKLWLIIGGFVIAVGSIFILWTTFNEVSTYKPINNSKDTFQVDSEELIGLTMRIPGAKHDEYWELNCAKMINSNKIGNIANINGQYFSADKPIYAVKARSGSIYWEKSVIKLYGEVKLTAQEKSQLFADIVTINTKLQTINAEHHVILKNKSLQANMDEVDTDINLNQIRSKGLTKVLFTQTER